MTSIAIMRGGNQPCHHRASTRDALPDSCASLANTAADFVQNSRLPLRGQPSIRCKTCDGFVYSEGAACAELYQSTKDARGTYIRRSARRRAVSRCLPYHCSRRTRRGTYLSRVLSQYTERMTPDDMDFIAAHTARPTPNDVKPENSSKSAKARASAPTEVPMSSNKRVWWDTRLARPARSRR